MVQRPAGMERRVRYTRRRWGVRVGWDFMRWICLRVLGVGVGVEVEVGGLFLCGDKDGDGDMVVVVVVGCCDSGSWGLVVVILVLFRLFLLFCCLGGSLEGLVG